MNVTEVPRETNDEYERWLRTTIADGNSGPELLDASNVALKLIVDARENKRRLELYEELRDCLSELREWHKMEYCSNASIDARVDAVLAKCNTEEPPCQP